MALNNEEMNMALYNKMATEQDKFRDWLLAQPPATILEHAYEYTVREDIVMAMECLDLSDEKAAVLLASPSPVGDAYEDFQKIETDYMDILRECIEERAESICRQNKSPIYRHSGIYAQEHGESEDYVASHKANVACRDAVVQAISAHYHDYHLDSKEAVQEVFHQFGADRTLYVLAATVQAKDWDGRFSSQNKQWAKTVPVVEDIDSWGQNRTTEFVVDAAHPGLVDLFLNRAKREYAQEQGRDTGKGQTDRADGKQSIKEQLSAPSAHGDKPPTKSNDREVR